MTDQRSSSPLPSFVRYLILGVALVLFGVGSWIGLQRTAFQPSDSADIFRVQLGPIMVSGLLGTAIAALRTVEFTILNRSSSRKNLRFLWWAVPVSSAFGGLLLLKPETAEAGRWLITMGSLGFMAMTLRILDLIPQLHTILMAFGGAGWAFGNLLWLGGANFSTLLPAWALFIILTTIGEQYELLNLQSVGRLVLASFYTGGGLMTVGALLSPLNSDLAVRVSGLGALTLTLGLFFYEVTRERGRMTGLSRFSSLAVHAGLVWLGVYGVIGIRIGFVPTDPTFRALNHSLLFGFGVGMMAGQAPYSLPALLNRRVVFHPWLVRFVIGLHISLVIMILGDLLNWPAGLPLGGALITLSGVLYVVLMMYALWTNRHTE